MKSNVCKIENGTRDLDAILKESRKVAVYNDLDQKQAMHLRLICEEIDGMLPNIINDFSGDFWIDFTDGVCKVNVSVRFEEFTIEKKDELIGIAKDKKNAAAVGIVGKIRSELENIFMDEESLKIYAMASGATHSANGYGDGVEYAYLWTLEQYRDSVKKEDKTEAWDELEKSIIAAIADDIIVGVKGKQADITIVKKFA